MMELYNPTEMPHLGHLRKFEKAVPPGAEWQLVTPDWLVLQLSEGIAYALDHKGSKELPCGGLILCPPKTEITITASVLGRAVFRGMAIWISSLAGFLTALERQCLETEVAREFAPFLMLPADHPLAKRATQIFGQQAPSLSHRLALAHTFAELVSPQLSEALDRGKENGQHGTKGRLRQFIGQLPESELSSLSLGQMAKMLHCCERHASRMFREEWGTGFLSYVAELRLEKACHLLLQGNLKIIDVALESGHGSRVHFNYVFKKRFKMTPTEWRERQTAPPRRSPRSRWVQAAAAAGLMLMTAFGTLRGQAATVAGGNAPQPAATAAKTNAPAARPPLRFQVDRYEVKGNTVLSSNVINRVLAPFTGKEVDISTITNAMGTLQLEYYQRGFLTVKVTAPPQQVTNKVVVFEATEGKLAAVKILHNHYFSSNNIMAALPYVKTLESGNHILNAKIFQTELDRANSNPDRQISPEVRPGLEPGTSALIMDVKDRLPLHGRADLDNYSPPGTPELRINANVSYENLWQLEHTLGLQYGFSPDLMKPSIGDGTHLSLNPLDTPDVTYYSGFYRAPLGAPEAVESQIAGDQTHFGYNETTKQFVTPPATGRPEFTAYISRTTTGPTISGPVSTVVDNSLLNIQKQLISQQYTSQTTAGGRLSFPLPKWQEIQSSWSLGMDYKQDKVVTLPTNYFYYTTIVTHGNNSSAPPTIVHQNIPIAGVATYPDLNYTPLFLGWSGSRQDRWGQIGPAGALSNRFDGNLSLVAGTGGTLSHNKTFPVLIANAPDATTEFVAIRPQLSRTQVLPDNFTLYGNASGQWANEPLLNLEQFALGGNSIVRGYREGEYYADTGWLTQLELRSPVYWRGINRRIGTQFTLFNDYGQGYELNSASGEIPHENLWGVGAAVNFNLGPHIESHIIVGWPLLDSTFTKAGHERISFSISAQL